MDIRSTWRYVLGVLTAIGMLVESTVAQEPPGVVGRFGTLDYRTAGWCSTAALSPDGKVLAVAGAQTIALTDLANGKTIGQFEEGDAILLSFLDQGKTLVSVNSQGMVRYWSLEKGSESRQPWQAFLPKHNPNSDAVMSPSGNLLLALDESNVNVWDLNKQRRLRQIHMPPNHGPFAISSDGNAIAAYNDVGLVVLDAATGKPKATTDQFQGYPGNICFSPDGQRLATCAGYDKYRVWDATTLREQCAFDRHDRGRRQMTFSPDSKLLATTHEDGFLRVWDLQSKKEICKSSLVAEGFRTILESVLFSPDQKRIIAVEHAVMRIWDAATGRELTADSRPQHRAHKMIASTDGKTLAAMHGRALHVWDVATFKQRFHVNDVEYGIDFSRTPGKLVYALGDHSAHVVDALSGQELTRMDGHRNQITAITFAADDKEILTVSYDGTLRAWNASTGKELRSHVVQIPQSFRQDHYEDHRYDTFTLDGQMLITRFIWKDNYQLSCVSTKTGEQIAERKPARELSGMYFAPDGRTYVGRGRGYALDIFDSATGESIIPLRAVMKEFPRELVGGFCNVAYSPDSRFLAVSDEVSDGIELWEIQARKKVHTISHMWGGFTFVGNNFLATPASDTTVLLWDVSKLRKQP